MTTFKVHITISGVEKIAEFPIAASAESVQREMRSTYGVVNGTLSSLPERSVIVMTLHPGHEYYFRDFDTTSSVLQGCMRLKVNGLPQLGNKRASNSERGYGCHKKCHPFIIRPNEHFAILEDCNLDNLPDVTSMALMQSSDDSVLPVWNNEAQLLNYVEMVLRDVIHLLNLSSSVQLQPRVPLAVIDLFPDTILFRLQGFVMGIAVVKTPSFIGKDDLENEELNNQLASYMLQLRLTYNLKEVIAIASTYHQWKVFWLEGSEWLVNATSLAEIKRVKANVPMNFVDDHQPSTPCGETITSLEEELEEEEEVTEEDNLEYDMNASFVEEDEASLQHLPNSMESFTVDNEGKERIFTIYSTQVYHYNDPALIELLSSAILKMTFSSLSEQTIFDVYQEVKYPLVKKQDSFIYAYLPRDIQFKFSFSINSKSFFLLYEFHGGRDGRVWMATTSTGNLCVVKFSHGITTPSFYAKEAQAWREIWGVPAFELMLLGYPALVMPYCFHGVVFNGAPCFMNLKSRGKVGPFALEDFANNGTQNRISKRSLQYFLNDPLKTAQLAIQEMAKRGYKHEDLKFQHVGLLPYCSNSSSGMWKVRPVLLDLHQIRKIDENEETIMQVIQDGMDQVVASLVGK